MSVDASLSTSSLNLSTLFPFELDDFQKQAIAALNAGKSVVVCAPTGSGKTLIGEYAIHRALSRGKRVFYTTPLKALSNQKLRDFRDRFGFDQVGLLTGDVSINRDAPILVMTTEIFRNMLYGTPIGEVGTSVQDVEAVVLDECHYMNDRQRGTVWEESIIYCPAQIQLVALSATIDNSDQLTDWINQVHGPTELIYSDFRPVPLRFSFCSPSGLMPLLNHNQKGLNPKLKGKGKSQGRRDTPNLATVVGRLQERDMLPAIYFIFSRRGCEQAIAELSNFSLVTPEETAQLKTQIDAFLERNPGAGRAGHIEPLYRGIAAHHAGILPAWKGLVEELFQQGLIKVVFATETLAAGINMPARTTVIASLSKRTDRGHRLLNASEFLQMAGRAGRRGMDEVGYVVTVQSRFEGAPEAAFLATSAADPLVSQFTPSYGMVLNLLQTHTLDQAKALIERSFGQYLAMLRWQPQMQELERLQNDLGHQQAQFVGITADEMASYEKLQERLKEEKRLLKLLHHQAQEVHANDIALAVSFAVAGTLLGLKGKHVAVAEPVAAVLVAKTQGSGQFPNLICLSQDNRWYVVTVGDVVGLHAEIPRLAEVDHLSIPPDLIIKPGQYKRGDETTQAIARRIRALPSLEEQAPEVLAQLERVQAVEAELQAHSLSQTSNPKLVLKRRQQLGRLEQEVRDREDKLRKNAQRYWNEFVNLMNILHHFGCLESVNASATSSQADLSPETVLDGAHNALNTQWRPTALGRVASAIRGDNELWLAMVLASGELDDFAPHHFAAACASLVTEISRSDTWTDYELSPEVDNLLHQLRGMRHELIKVQNEYGVDILVLPAEWRDRKLSALVEHWALGEEWPAMLENTSLDEGDIVRILRRTLDFLSQIPHVPHLSESLYRTARQAIQLIDRFPVNEAAD